MDHVVCHMQDSTSGIQWSDVAHASIVVRGTARVSFGLFILYTAETPVCDCTSTRTTVSSRLHADERRTDDRFSCCLADVEAWMTIYKPTTSECDQDLSTVAGLVVQCRQTHDS